jgi:hypothetical protein
MDRRPGWKEKLEILKKDDPAWVYNTLEVNPQVAPLLENGEDQRNDPLRLLEVGHKKRILLEGVETWTG